jgi:(1->4)-alpha-D-glucan 1-alpha-D-glucosylmutase
MTACYREISGENRDFHELAHEAKLEQARTTFETEAEWLRARLPDLEEEVDIAAALAAFRVYRTYVDPDSSAVDDLDRRAVADANLPARLANILLLEERGHDAFVIRFQQTTPPVIAKGVEDTAFYRYNRLVCLNEVGGDPSRFSLPLAEFHAANLERARRFPNHLLTTQTHDTKRSGDVRARISALTWYAEEWHELVADWRRVNNRLRTGSAPDGNEEYLIYQTLVGAWPLEPERLEGYLEKALREAKTNTSWIEPNESWEIAVKGFARSLYDHSAFRESFDPFAERVAAAGEQISLAHTLLKLTCPGFPDIYQGDELWSLSLVDPDNRRPVDWSIRRRLLQELRDGLRPTRETAKLYLIWKALALRKRRPEVFDDGTYQPVDAGEDVCCFTRADAILVAVPIRRSGHFEPPEGYDDVLEGADLGVWLLERR